LTFNIVAVYSGVILSLILLVPIKEIKKEYAPIIVAALSVLVIGVSLKHAVPLFEYVKGLGDGIEEGYFSILFKCFGIATATHVVSDMCSDFGAQSLAGKVEFVGKIGILMTTLPLVEALLDLTEKLV